MAFKYRIAAFPAVAALTVPLLAAAPSQKQAAATCPSCFDCSDDAGPQLVRVRLYNQTRLDDAVFAEVLEVSNRIWKPYGVNVEASDSPDAVTVVVSAGTLRGGADGGPIAVGDTLFTKGHATPYIHLWLGAAEILAQDSNGDGQPFTTKPTVERDAILLRMLGVALAHELGHYLLDTSDHSSGGLLRQTLAAREMEHPDPAHLRLTRKQERLMCHG